MQSENASPTRLRCATARRQDGDYSYLPSSVNTCRPR